MPASQVPQESTETACVTVEKLPAGHALHRGMDPSLYVPPLHAVQLELQSGQGAPLCSLHPTPHETQTVAPAALPVFAGQG